MVEFLKSASKKISEKNNNTTSIVSHMLKEIELGGEDIVKEFSQKLDNYYPGWHRIANKYQRANKCEMNCHLAIMPINVNCRISNQCAMDYHLTINLQT